MLPFGRQNKLANSHPENAKYLINELNENSAWKVLALHLVKTKGGKFCMSWVSQLEQKGNAMNAKHTPAELLLNELKARCCNIQRLCDMLRACKLLDALYILQGPELLVIVEQPKSRSNENRFEIAIGNKLITTCKATGLPPPRYQWFHENVELPDQTSSTLNLPIESFHQEGNYQCKVSQYNRDEKLVDQVSSVRVSLTILPTPVAIIEQPMSCKVKNGQSLILNCKAEGHPSPQYQWYKDNEELHGENFTKSTLQVDQFQRKHTGTYYCRVSNSISEQISEKIKVEVDYPRLKAKAKIALVIGNSNYQNEHKLSKTENDANLIATCLREIDFYVICLYNLNLMEMKNVIDVFGSMLDDGVYGVFYFAGHGFMIEEAHMMPIDVPESCLKMNTISASYLLASTLKNDPALLVVILDMCLNKPDDKTDAAIYQEQSEMTDYKCNRNLIRAYSTCDFAKSYEPSNKDNGNYMMYLSKNITRNIPVKEVFEETRQSMVELLGSKMKDQIPMITDMLTQPYRYLTDAVHHKELMSEYVLKLKKFTTFNPKPVRILFRHCNVSCQVTVECLKSPCMNVILLTISGLENWNVKFIAGPDKEVELYSEGAKCHIYNPQRLTAEHFQGSLEIQITNNGITHSKRFNYMKHIPTLLGMIGKRT